MATTKLNTFQKALHLNLNSNCFGTFAEIGAGQEVSNFFFKAGAASGTIAKTLSAYDMKVSDSYYGPTKRYVSKNRLTSMLDFEYERIIYQLSDFAKEKCFFSLASTVETINYSQTNQGQGWLGVKFQSSPNTKPNQCVIHFLLHDKFVANQQEVIGVLGVNLLHGIFTSKDELTILRGLLDNISKDSIEVNYIEFSGNNFKNTDNRLLALELVKSGLSKTAMFGPDKKVLQPLNALYKSDVIVQRGRFRPLTLVNEDLFKMSSEYMINNQFALREKLIKIAEITLHNLEGSDDQTSIQDFLNRADLICELGYSVIITDFKYHYQLTDYFNQYVKVNSLNLVMGLSSLEKVIDPNTYHTENKEIMGVMSSLLFNNNKLLIYPTLVNEVLAKTNDLQIDNSLKLLLSYLKTKKKLFDIGISNKELLQIQSENVFESIKANNHEWYDKVPERLIGLISQQSKQWSSRY